MPRLILGCSSAVLFLLGGYYCRAEDAVTENVDGFVQDEMVRQNIPDVSQLVNHGKIRAERSSSSAICLTSGFYNSNRENLLARMV